MLQQTYSNRSNARRAARLAGLDPDQAVVAAADGRYSVGTPITPITASVTEERANGHDELDQRDPTEAADPVKQIDDKSGLDIPTFLKRDATTSPRPRPITRPADEHPGARIIMPKTKASTRKRDRLPKSADKTALVISMLKGKGASVEQLTKATGWLPHTLRARISGLAKPPQKLKIERERKDGVTTYRIG